jgi:hypothetical protein
MIPEQILEKIDRPAFKVVLLEKLKLYIDVNSVDKVILIGSSIVENFLMNVVMPFFDLPQTPEWLAEWWKSGLTRNDRSGILPPHKDFIAYAKEIITEVYQERKVYENQD